METMTAKQQDEANQLRLLGQQLQQVMENLEDGKIIWAYRRLKDAEQTLRKAKDSMCVSPAKES